MLIPRGSRSHSVPASSREEAQTFETTEDLTARWSWNDLRVRRRRPAPLTPEDLRERSELYVAGTANALSVGDRLLFVFGGGSGGPADAEGGRRLRRFRAAAAAAGDADPYRPGRRQHRPGPAGVAAPDPGRTGRGAAAVDHTGRRQPQSEAGGQRAGRGVRRAGAGSRCGRTSICWTPPRRSPGGWKNPWSGWRRRGRWPSPTRRAPPGSSGWPPCS
ncbi:hypothetical protein LUW77_02430 [Streptomyces radiopugnans]|nr:hypothetical protein LUW77_02430 [Streptomyces radiopugnans]